MTTPAGIRILLQADWPNDTSTRLWDGAGPFIDGDGMVWRGSGTITGLEAIEAAINGEAFTMNVTLTGVESEMADSAWLSYDHGDLVGGTVRVLILPCDEHDVATGPAETRFTGTVDNIIIDDSVQGEKPASRVTLECTNRFSLRRITHGAVLSDTDQRARALAANPLEDADRFCERVPLLQDKTIVWPRWS